MGEWIEQPLTVGERESNKERFAVASRRPLPDDRDRWGPGPSHVDPAPGDQWFDVDTGRAWVFRDDDPA